MDVSDGLVGDFGKLCRTSGVSAEIDVARVPLSAAARAALAIEPGLLADMLTGGDDYEIVCTAPEDRADAFLKAAEAAGIALTDVGRVVAGQGFPRFLDGAGHPMTFKQTSYSHF
jgi:thiamine-monophosphate kinase